MAKSRIDTIACVVLMIAARQGAGTYRDNSDQLFNKTFSEFVAVDDKLEIDFSEFEKAIDLLKMAGIARSSPEKVFFERFHRIDHGELPKLIGQADKENSAVLDLLRDGLFDIPSDETVTLDFIKKHPMLRNYADFGDEWLKSRLSNMSRRNNQDQDFERKDLNPQKLAILQEKSILARRDIDVADLSNEDRAYALAYLDAIDALLRAPEPDCDLLWIILERANAMAGIAGFFLALFSVLK